MSEPWVILGEYADDWGHRVPVGLPLRDLALQAFALGSTVVIEPHGDLILDPQEGILAALPPEALGRVVVVDLTSPWPPQVNLAAAGLAAGRSVAVDTAMRCIHVVEGASWNSAVRMREILEHTLHLLLAVYGHQASLAHLQRFLTDAPFRRAVLSRAGDDVGESRAYWQQCRGFDNYEGGHGCLSPRCVVYFSREKLNWEVDLWPKSLMLHPRS